ncbi:hypothetical protein ACJX0J_008134 [Zea mays]
MYVIVRMCYSSLLAKMTLISWIFVLTFGIDENDCHARFQQKNIGRMPIDLCFIWYAAAIKARRYEINITNEKGNKCATGIVFLLDYLAEDRITSISLQVHFI